MALSLVALRVVPRRDGCWAMTASQATQRLGNLREGSRQSAIAVLARSGQIASPLSGSDGASLLSGTTQGARAGAIRELAALFKGDLSGQETEAILGTEATLFEDNRQGAIAALARAKRFGPSLSEDAALALKGTTQRSRAGSIAEIAPYLRAGVTGHGMKDNQEDPIESKFGSFRLSNLPICHIAGNAGKNSTNAMDQAAQLQPRKLDPAGSLIF